MNFTDKMKILFKATYDKDTKFMVMNRIGYYDSMPDAEYLKKQYKHIMGQNLDLDNPKKFSEKLQWLKLFDRKPLYTVMVDKILAKEYIANLIGSEYIIPTIGVWSNPNEINFDALPNKFVLKCNHNSGLGMCICKDKNELNKKEIIKKLSKGLSQNYFFNGREWPYKDVNRLIFAEKLMEDVKDKDELGLIDYKFFCFNGVPRFAYVAQGAAKEYISNITLLDLNWNPLPFQRLDHPQFKVIPKKPINLDKMLKFSTIIARNIPFLRVDFYEINDKLYFGEATFFPGSGYIPFNPPEWDEKLGEWISLPIPQ